MRLRQSTNRLMLLSNAEVEAAVAIVPTEAVAAASVVSVDKEMVGTGREVRGSFSLNLQLDSFTNSTFIIFQVREATAIAVEVVVEATHAADERTIKFNQI